MNRLVLVERADGAPVRHYLRGAVVRVGRSLDNDLVIPDMDVSRHHLELRWQEGILRASSPGQKTASINGRPLAGEEPLRPGCELRIGQRAFTVLFDVTADASVHAAETRTPVAALGAGTVALVGSSEQMCHLRALLARLAPSDTTVLLQGEQGTGKELAAQLLHDLSPRARGPWVVVDCSAIPGALAESELFGIESGTATGVNGRPGLIETAGGGTLFLDEIGELDLQVQAKLLRFLQEKSVARIGSRGAARRVDVRVVAATNRDLEKHVAAGRFRDDLLGRLQPPKVVLPALREHREDIPAIVHDVLQRLIPRPAGISDEAVAELARRSFRANVRGLLRALETAAALAGGGRIDVLDLPDPEGSAVPDMVEELRARLLARDGDFERDLVLPYRRRDVDRKTARELLRRLLDEFGTPTELAERLRVGPKRLMNWLREQRLRPSDES